EAFSVFGEVVEKDGSEQSAIELGISVEEKSKRVFLNGDKAGDVSRYLRIFPTVPFVPRDVDIVYGSPSGRRKFLDRYIALLFPKALNALQSYQKIIRNKNAILKNYPVDERQLASLNTLVALYSATIMQTRQELITALLPYMQEYYSELAEHDGQVGVLLEETFLTHGSSERTAKSYEDVLSQVMKRERERRSSLVGPHMDDLLFSLGGRSARQYSSQGQARSIVLALILAVVQVIKEKLEITPTLLLDDFSSELDRGRMSRFFDLLKGNSHQVFVTGTDLSSSNLGASDCARFHVNQGAITPL
ncbi:MAG: DNA replication and repair protein RecF, partial [Bdellovibrionales bacterium]|nr:DNA replication and repair protein RecF [Bdellovibrionales bacterium]